MAKRTLAEVYGYSSPKRRAKKLSSRNLRSVILQEVRAVLNEADESTGPVNVEGVPEAYQKPAGTAMKGGDNIKGIDATEIVAQLVSGDVKMPIFDGFDAHLSRSSSSFLRARMTSSRIWIILGVILQLLLSHDLVHAHPDIHAYLSGNCLMSHVEAQKPSACLSSKRKVGCWGVRRGMGISSIGFRIIAKYKATNMFRIQICIPALIARK